MSQSARTIGLGLIGCGSIAEESHLPGIKNTRSLELVAVADIDESKARALGQKFGAAQAYGDYRRLLANSRVEAVDICTPTKYHAEITGAAARAGKHVLCEKPIALRLEEADHMINACRENGVKLMIAHSRRFIPRYSIVKKIIEEGSLGELAWATQISRRHIPDPGSWYLDPRMTYGPILEGGIHEADLLRWFFEDEVVEVCATARSRTSNAEVYDQVFSVLKFKKGGVASFEVTYVTPKAYTQYTTLELLGSSGLVSASDHHMNVVIRGAEETISYPLAYWDLLTVNSAYQIEIEAFADCIAKDTEPPVTGSDARSALEIILAVKRSIEHQQPTRLPLGG